MMNDEQNKMIEENERMRKALEYIVKESSCHGIDCDWGDTCFGVVARKGLED